MSAIFRLGLIVVLAVLLGGCAAGPEPAVEPPGDLSWTSCDGDGWPSTARCADLPVPLDHARPGGPRIVMRVSWVPAADPVRGRGVLVTNPGGPGEPGLRTPVGFPDVASAPVRAALERYDRIGFDPRGVGASEPVACGLGSEQATAVTAPTPSRAGPSVDEALARSTADACARHGGPVLAHMTTADVAGDLEVLRRALGVPTFSYYGSSYGTYLGVVYDALFPGRLDRVVLDSLVDSQHGWYAQNRLVAPAVERRFDDFAGWAAERPFLAGLGDTPTEVRERYSALTAERQSTPLMVGGAVVDGALLRRMTYLLVGRDRFATLAGLLRCAGEPDGHPCGPLVVAALGWWGSAPPDDASASAFLAVTCADSPWPTGSAAYRRAAVQDAARYPVTAGGFAQVSPCAFWPVPPHPAVTAARHDGPARFLLLNNTRDRISELGGARSTRDALGSRARLVVVDGWNHQILSNRDPCADGWITAWLADGRLPDTDVRCP